MSGNPIGRPKGSRNKRTQALLEAAQVNGEMPLDYMLRVMRDPNAPPKRRDEMAKAAAPFLHSKLASIENLGPPKEPTTTGIEVRFVVPKRRPDDILDDHVRFSNRPVWVKRFQTIHHSRVDVAHGLALLFGIGTRPFQHGVRGRGGTIFRSALPSD